VTRCRNLGQGRWEVIGRVCGCGGTLFIDRNGTGNFKYETFCGSCSKCDPNGWRTLAECLANLTYFESRELKE
jgi:hypothetical protein